MYGVVAGRLGHVGKARSHHCSVFESASILHQPLAPMSITFLAWYSVMRKA